MRRGSALPKPGLELFWLVCYRPLARRSRDESATRGVSPPGAPPTSPSTVTISLARGTRRVGDLVCFAERGRRRRRPRHRRRDRGQPDPGAATHEEAWGRFARVRDGYLHTQMSGAGRSNSWTIQTIYTDQTTWKPDDAPAASTRNVESGGAGWSGQTSSTTSAIARAANSCSGHHVKGASSSMPTSSMPTTRYLRTIRVGGAAAPRQPHGAPRQPRGVVATTPRRRRNDSTASSRHAPH